MSYYVEAAFRDLLMANDALRALVSGRLYPGAAPQNIPDDQMPSHLVYSVISTPSIQHLTAPSSQERSRMQIDCYARSYEGVKEIETAVREACDGYSGIVTNPRNAAESFDLRSVRLIDRREGYEFTSDESGWHRVSIDCYVWHPVSVPIIV